MKSKHTPGDWSTDCGAITIEDQIIQLQDGIGTNREWQPITIHDEDGPAEVVALCHPVNAKLIAAAPDLLEACAGLLLEVGKFKLNVRKDFSLMVYKEAAKKAIDKATHENPVQ